MLTRLALSAIAATAVVAGGSTTVLVTAAGNEHGLAQRSPRAGEAQAGSQSDTDESTTAAEAELPPCPADVKNHGAYVSSVAKANRGHAVEGETAEDHGALVSAAAQSDCGKPEGAGAEDAEDESVKPSKAEKDAAKAARKAEQARGKSDAARATAPGQATTP